MTVESPEDRAQFLLDFGVATTWSRDGVPQEAFLAVFDRPSLLVEQAEITLIDRDASLLARESDLPDGAAEGDPIAVAGESQAYKCRNIRPDGSGFAIVDLKKA